MKFDAANFFLSRFGTKSSMQDNDANIISRSSGPTKVMDLWKTASRFILNVCTTNEKCFFKKLPMQIWEKRQRLIFSYPNSDYCAELKTVDIQ